MPKLEQVISKLPQYMTSLFKLVVGTWILGSALYGIVLGKPEAFIVSLPFVLTLAPGYLQILPTGGIKHGTLCNCAKSNPACELGWWFGLAQKGVLLLPVALMSIFASSFFSNQYDVKQALVDTSLSMLVIITYSIICACGCYLMVKHSPR
ncbi:MAG TPA: hypothetical protein V6C81_20640 [Planktothrix sp.]|jgi:hypothetical protein